MICIFLCWLTAGDFQFQRQWEGQTVHFNPTPVRMTGVGDVKTVSNISYFFNRLLKNDRIDNEFWRDLAGNGYVYHDNGHIAGIFKAKSEQEVINSNLKFHADLLNNAETIFETDTTNYLNRSYAPTHAENWSSSARRMDAAPTQPRSTHSKPKPSRPQALGYEAQAQQSFGNVSKTLLRQVLESGGKDVLDLSRYRLTPDEAKMEALIEFLKTPAASQFKKIIINTDAVPAAVGLGIAFIRLTENPRLFHLSFKAVGTKDPERTEIINRFFKLIHTITPQEAVKMDSQEQKMAFFKRKATEINDTTLLDDMQAFIKKEEPLKKKLALKEEAEQMRKDGFTVIQEATTNEFKQWYTPYMNPTTREIRKGYALHDNAM